MNDETLLEFYQYRMALKLQTVPTMERVLFMADLFGKRWPAVYERLITLYPELVESNADVQRSLASALRPLAEMANADILGVIAMAGNFSEEERAAFCAGVRRCAQHVLEQVK